MRCKAIPHGRRGLLLVQDTWTAIAAAVHNRSSVGVPALGGRPAKARTPTLSERQTWMLRWFLRAIRLSAGTSAGGSGLSASHANRPRAARAAANATAI